MIEKRFKLVNKSQTFKNILDEHKLKERSVLDIGCSYGEFLIHFGEGSVGLTISKEEADFGQTKNLDIRYGNIEEGKIPITETFDVIFANNIFEHLYSPHAFLVDIKKYLKDDGILILGVPCIPYVEVLMRLTKFRGSLAVGHINFFNKSTLKKTVERAGWDVGEVRSFHFSNKWLDLLLSPIAPHFYVTATPDANFQYHEKRKRELEGYNLSQKT